MIPDLASYCGLTVQHDHRILHEREETHSVFGEKIHLKKLLADPGCNFDPYLFHLDKSDQVAPESGLEGFVFILNKYAPHCGEKLAADLPHMCSYVSNLLRASGWDNQLFEDLQDRLSSPHDITLEQFSTLVNALCNEARERLIEIDPALRVRDAKTYQIYTRAFNLAGLREAQGREAPKSDLLFRELTPEDVPEGTTVVRFTCTFPISEVNKIGELPSPYAISDHYVVDPALGSQQDILECFERFRKAGIEVAFELSLNHTGIPSKDAPVFPLADPRYGPELYIHTTDKPEDESGYFYYQDERGKEYWIRQGGYLYFGSRAFWDDTLQLDISNPKTAQYFSEVIGALSERYGVEIFRVDMAYQLFHDTFAQNWGTELSYQMSPDVEEGFLYSILSNAKEQNPRIAFLAEAFGNWDRLSAAGFDLVYNKNEYEIFKDKVHHTGWYNALERRNPEEIRSAIDRAEFLSWQVGGSGMLLLMDHQDLPSPKHAFGDWIYGAAFLTMLFPGAAKNLYAGNDVFFEDTRDTNGKVITFGNKTAIAWHPISEAEHQYARWTAHCRSLYKLADELEKMIPNPIATAVRPSGDNETWVGYCISSRDPECHERRLVIANPSTHQTQVTFHDSSDGSHYVSALEGFGWRVVPL